MNKDILAEDSIGFQELYDFLVSQAKTILVVFFTVAILGTIYFVLQPVTYSSVANVEIGQITSPYKITAPLETQEEVAYKYSTFAQVSPVKGTRIVKISAVRLSPEESEESIINTINLITSSHEEILLNKENNLIKSFEYGFEINEFIGSKNAYSNVHKVLTGKLIYKPYGYNWKYIE